MMPLCLYCISGWPWQRVLHMSIFLLYHLRRHILLSLHFIPAHFLNLTRGTWAVVSLAIIGDGDFKSWGSGLVHCTLTGWPAHRLRLARWNNSYMERHYGRDRGRPIYWTHAFGLVCGILARW